MISAGHASHIVRRLTPKFDSIKLLTSSCLINTGSSQTLENHLCNAILTSLSSSSSVDADVEGKGRAGIIATKIRSCQYVAVREGSWHDLLWGQTSESCSANLWNST